MTDRPAQHHTPHEDEQDVPLEPWMLELAREAADELDADVVVPREMMWARINRDRRAAAAGAVAGGAAAAPLRRGFPWPRVAAIAAVLVGGVAIGRYIVPVAPTTVVAADSAQASTDQPRNEMGLGPDALAELPPSNDPVRVAMGEHLVRTVALLTTVRDQDPSTGRGADVSAWARELLSTTRLLIDEPQLRDERTRRLLQDLELVLVQIIQAHGSAPETQRAPKETLRETNLLPRIRAVVTASRSVEDTINGLTNGGD